MSNFGVQLIEKDKHGWNELRLFYGAKTDEELLEKLCAMAREIATERIKGSRLFFVRKNGTWKRAKF